MRRTLDSLHPAVTAIYFISVLLMTMLCMDPVCVVESLCVGSLCLGGLVGFGKTFRRLALLLPLALAVAAVNAAFNHRGVTRLATLPSGNWLTWESVLYGLTASGMLIAALIWFAALSEVLTSDKLIALIGHVLPRLAMVLSMALRLTPRLSERFRDVSDARSAVSGKADSRRGRVLEAMTVFSAALTWAIENAAETAESMRARGYGLPGRSAYSPYRFTKHDASCLLWLLICLAAVAALALADSFSFSFYPSIDAAPWEKRGTAAVVTAALGLSPWLWTSLEGLRWKLSVRNN